MQVGRLLLSELVLQVRGVFDKPDLFRGAPRVVFFHGHGQRLGQEPEGNRGHEGDDAGDDVAQPPGPDPAGVVRGDGHSLCGETGVFRKCVMDFFNSATYLIYKLNCV